MVRGDEVSALDSEDEGLSSMARRLPQHPRLVFHRRRSKSLARRRAGFPWVLGSDSAAIVHLPSTYMSRGALRDRKTPSVLCTSLSLLRDRCQLRVRVKFKPRSPFNSAAVSTSALFLFYEWAQKRSLASAVPGPSSFYNKHHFRSSENNTFVRDGNNEDQFPLSTLNQN